ncbi:hypothetical protein RMHFA_03840 (plasmid) [Roseomonas mucosa]|jgi:hypothetical protein|uniref:Uncharacterized protein n=2 Tax=Roseomonadaceae TaxID=3385906 RepID=A0A379PNR7_9PROT|nr:hypothetical protein [Roseomonas mucosa]ATR19342.1 hypothetical protein CTJ15_03000 [Roseomonas sp. FDAARGOS_362]QDD92748.1 hypothetical protein HVIM_03840 [Roseomonas mucosa]QDD97097.1 hypothetical protein ADP8_03840 [Roseomonas mucosa]QET91453.1 hypothetical protein FOB66_00480 [Roseomonas mucosa]USQ74066.1 hypothetical protein NF552_22975 [Roseomonas mucosa]
MPMSRKTAKPPAKRSTSLLVVKRPVAKAAPPAPARGKEDPTGKVMTRLRGSLGKDYRLDI